MPDYNPIDTTIAIVGNQPEALLLSVLFAEANTPTFLTGLFEPTALERREEVAEKRQPGFSESTPKRSG